MNCKSCTKKRVKFYATFLLLFDFGFLLSFPYEEKVDYLGEKKRYKLSDDCKIIVQAKDEANNGKICYIDKEDLAYIARVYGFVRPDGSHESYVKSEYVYPFLCVMDQNHEVRALRECYDIFEVSKNLLDKVKN